MECSYKCQYMYMSTPYTYSSMAHGLYVTYLYLFTWVCSNRGQYHLNGPSDLRELAGDRVPFARVKGQTCYSHSGFIGQKA